MMRNEKTFRMKPLVCERNEHRSIACDGEGQSEVVNFAVVAKYGSSLMEVSTTVAGKGQFVGQKLLEGRTI